GYSCESGKPVNTTVKSCATGACQYQCTAGLVNVSASSMATGIKCIDPKSDNTYCGATSSSSTGMTCGSGKVCVDGKCVQNSCSGSETLCSTSSGNTCINIKGSDTANCGACGYSCESGKPVNTTVKSCSTGTCQYQCTAGLVNVSASSTATGIKCIDPKSDNTYCGATSSSSTGMTCGSGKVCVDGKCVQNSCSGSETLCSTSSGNTCINIKGSDTANCGACGYSCESGKPINTTVKSCSTGVCQYECATGYENKGSGNTASTIQCVESVVCDAPRCILNGFCFTFDQMNLLEYTRKSILDPVCVCFSGFIMNSNQECISVE
ncbi:MAG: hypothetical protein ACI4VB_11065, partial [Bradymonadia bacterium]